LPDDYSSGEKYKVLYMHDGQMLFDSTATWNGQEWGVDEIVGQLIRSKQIPKTIVVGIWNTEQRHSEYFPQKPFESLAEEIQDSLLQFGYREGETPLFKSPIVSGNYLKFIVHELKPYIDQNYSTYTEAPHTSIMGSSMGGLISMYAICEYPEIFGSAACLSTHWPGSFDTLNNPIPQSFADYLEENLPDPSKHRIYFDFGTETLDAYYEPFQAMVDSVMLRSGYTSENWITRKFEGENHSEKAWNKRLHIPMIFINN
jgi:predicted alpha/beta superfamily hydrolase